MVKDGKDKKGKKAKKEKKDKGQSVGPLENATEVKNDAQVCLFPVERAMHCLALATHYAKPPCDLRCHLKSLTKVKGVP